MKRSLAIWMALVLIFAQLGALAEGTELVGAVQEGLAACSDEELAEISALVAAEEASRSTQTAAQPSGEILQKGDKNDAVKALQARLVELNYLEGAADGDFGGKTAAAVSAFQKAAGLTATGIADEETQTALFASDAPKQKLYQKFEASVFQAISRDPDSYEGQLYKITGKVLQVLEEDYDDGTYVEIRIATKGNYDNVIYVTYLRPAGETRILEDDRVTLLCVSAGLLSYEAVSGATITLPSFTADSVALS